nr:heavy-metal-associated domain-containing protein [uncultured Dethiosulfovibrio sp.]
MAEYKLTVPDMSCSHCEGRIKSILEGLNLPSFSVDLAGKTVTVETDDLNRVLNALDDGGYEAKEKA